MAAVTLRAQPWRRPHPPLLLATLLLSIVAQSFISPSLSRSIGLLRMPGLGGDSGDEDKTLGRVRVFEKKLAERAGGDGTPAPSDEKTVPSLVSYFKESLASLPPPPEPSACQGRRLFIYPNIPPEWNQLALEACASLGDCPSISRDGLHTVLAPFSGTSTTSSSDGSNAGGNSSSSSDSARFQGSGFGLSAWQATSPHALGVLFHARAQRYDCLASDWRDADAVLVPVFLDVIRWLTDFPTVDKVALALAHFLEGQPAFQHRGGSDHFIVVGNPSWDFMREQVNRWGSNAMFLPALYNVTFVSTEASWRQDTISFPYPTGFHPADADEMANWQLFVAKSPRPYLVALGCGTRWPGHPAQAIRDELLSQCLGRPDQCRLLNCSIHCPLGNCQGVFGGCSDPRVVAGAFLSARFCLMPRGDSYTRRAIFDAIGAGCIPVSFNKETLQEQYIFQLSDDKSSFSVQIDQREVEEGRVNVVEELEKIPEDRVTAMKQRLIELMPNTVYKDHRRLVEKSKSFKDAFEIGLEGIFRHVQGKKQPS